MNKQDIYEYLDTNRINYEVTEHDAVFNMAEAAKISLPYPEAEAKNLFIRDDKKRNYYLITVKGDKRVDLKEFRSRFGTRALTFASADDLSNIMGLIPGSVTPLGLLNDTDCRVQFFLDSEFENPPGLIGIHPNDNTATVYLKPDDLIKIIKNRGNTVTVASF